MEFVDRGTDRIALDAYPEPSVEGRERVAPLAVLWPAMGVPARYYRPFAERLTAAGLAVVVADLRGTGASTPPPDRRSSYGYAELAADVGAVLEALKPRRDNRRTVLLGHSLGGQACALHLATEAAAGTDPGVDGLGLVAVGVPYWRRYPGTRRLVVLPYTQGIAATATLLRVWPGWGFGGRQARRVIGDWAFTARHGRYPRLDGLDVEAALAQVKTPVLGVSVEPDQYTPPATLEHLLAKMRSAPVTREHFAAPGLDHFKWVRAGAPIAERVAAWAWSLPT